MTASASHASEISEINPSFPLDTLKHETRVRPRVHRKSKERLRLGLYLCLLFADVVAIVGGVSLGNLVRFSEPAAQAGLALIAVLLPLYIIIAFSTRSYAIDVLQDVQLSVVRGLRAFLLAIAALLRSEEHTSELQSRENLVCRLLLE